MTKKRESQIRQAVREQIAGALQDDLDGGESIMKEVWEDCADDDEDAAAKDELAKIIRIVRASR